MSKEKSPFEKTAAALKIMGKKISAKKGTGFNILKCVFVPNRTAHAIATDSRVAAVLSLNQYEDFSKIDVLQELAFYADMQVLNYLNGRALVTAEKKEEAAAESSFRPGEIGVLDSVADAFGVLPIGTETIANVLYGAEAEGSHIATLTGLMLVAWPLRQNKDNIAVVPSKDVIQSYFAERGEKDESDGGENE